MIKPFSVALCATVLLGNTGWSNASKPQVSSQGDFFQSARHKGDCGALLKTCKNTYPQGQHLEICTRPYVRCLERVSGLKNKPAGNA